MKKIIIILIITLFIVANLSAGGNYEPAKVVPSNTKFEEDSQLPKLELGLTLGPVLYKEKDFMEEEGVMVNAFITKTHYTDNLMFQGEVKLGYGLVNYDGQMQDGTHFETEGIEDFLFECRGLIGYQFKKFITESDDKKIKQRSFVFSGLGYRYLSDDLSVETGGYLRESNYLYLPLGAGMIAINILKGKVHDIIHMQFEYDYLLEGLQISHFSDIDPGLNDIENVQKKGWGLKIHLDKILYLENVKIGPTISMSFWAIENSETAPIYYNGQLAGYAMEPENAFIEVSLGLIIGL